VDEWKPLPSAQYSATRPARGGPSKVNPNSDRDATHGVIDGASTGAECRGGLSIGPANNARHVKAISSDIL